MWQFGGKIEYTCNICEKSDEISISEDTFSIDCVGGSERGMGEEYIHEISTDLICDNCENEIHLEFEVSEYPIEFFNFSLNKSTGAETEGEPRMIYLEEIYHIEDVTPIQDAVKDLIAKIKQDPDQIRDITSRQFEEIIAEVFKKRGFTVELTKRTRDGGKDIVAISEDKLGIKTKFFIECKHYKEGNKIGVDVVRSLNGVKNQKEGPNKTIIATTSSFTLDAEKFVTEQMSSSWDMELADYNRVMDWIKNY